MRPEVRPSLLRWSTLSALLLEIERAIAGAARLDVTERLIRDRAGQMRFKDFEARFEARLQQVERRVDGELDRLTAERLDSDLARKQRAAAKESEAMPKVLAIVAMIFCVVTLGATPAAAQTNVLVWVAPNNTLTAVEAQGLTYTLYVNGAVTGLAVSGAACTGVPTPAPSAFACTSVVPVGVPANIGTKLELTALSPLGGGEGPRSIPFQQAPTAPTAFRKQ